MGVAIEQVHQRDECHASRGKGQAELGVFEIGNGSLEGDAGQRAAAAVVKLAVGDTGLMLAKGGGEGNGWDQPRLPSGVHPPWTAFVAKCLCGGWQLLLSASIATGLLLLSASMATGLWWAGC